MTLTPALHSDTGSREGSFMTGDNMSLPLYKAKKILEAGGFNAALMAEAKAVVEAVTDIPVAEGKVLEESKDIEKPEDLEIPEIP